MTPLDAQRRDLAAAEVRRRVSAPGDLHADARAAGADVVERGDRLGHVERLGMGGDRRRDQPDVPGYRRDPGRDQHRVQPAADPVAGNPASKHALAWRTPGFSRHSDPWMRRLSPATAITACWRARRW